MGKRDAKRSEIVGLFPSDVKVTLRRVDFTDLARSSAYHLSVKRGGEELPSVFFGQWHRERWDDVIDAVQYVKENFTYKGGTIL